MTISVSDCIAVARAELQKAKQQISDEIHTYPTPIAGCDAQFNHLLAERQRVSGALSALLDDVLIATPRSPRPQSGIENR